MGNPKKPESGSNSTLTPGTKVTTIQKPNIAATILKRSLFTLHPYEYIVF